MYKIVTKIPLQANETRIGADAPKGSENKRKLIELEKISKSIKHGK